ncbi:hypothetical protein CEQ90_14080 [Lewinellaceae bacterium SD302]|nr:hypothetical protein CEQ90_14080 [Lewinellaceae bacterium SD302]
MTTLKLLTRRELDIQAWDKCIQQAPNGLPYAYSWYLDIVSQENWSALVLEDYRAVMPLPFNCKLFGYPQLYQPILCQQLGIFGQISAAENATFLKTASQRFRRINLNLNASNFSRLPELAPGSMTARTNLLLPLDQPYAAIHSAYSKSLRKRLRKTETLLLCQPTKNSTTLIDLYRKQVGSRLNWPEENYQIVARLIEEASRRKAGLIRKIVDEAGRLHAIGFFLIGCGRVINLFGASSQEGRRSYAMHRLLDEVIQEVHQQENYFDFEGSEIPGVAEFFRSFGAHEEQYAHYHTERLPFWLRLALKTRKLTQ